MPTIPLHIRERIRALYLEGKNSNEIQKIVGHTRSAILNICKKVKNNLGVENLPRTGRQKKLTNRAMRNIVIKSKKNPFSTAREIRQDCSLQNNISVDTVKRVLRANNLYGRVAVKKPKLNRVQKKKRLAYAVENRSWSTLQWSKIIFSDESRIELIPKARQFVRRPKNEQHREKYTIKTTKFSPSIMVWGAIRHDGKRVIVKCNESVDAYEYQRILDEGLPRIYTTRYIFQQDGATCHTARSTTQYLSQKGIRVMKNWPSQSPDISIIENLWNILKENVKKHDPKSKEELWKFAEEEFYAIPDTRIVELYESLERRIKSILANRGGNTEY